MKNIKIFYNPNSGQGDGKEIAQETKLALMAQNIPEKAIEIIAPEDEKDAIQQAKIASQDGTDLVVILGGDGSINKISGGLFEGHYQGKIGIIPTGTINNFAQALHIPLDKETAIATLSNSQDQCFDIAKVNNHYMLSSLTLGVLADLAENVGAKDKRQLGVLAYISGLIKVIKHYKRYPIRLEYDDQVIHLKSRLLLITMTPMIAGQASFDPNAEIDDGLMRIYSLKKINLIKLFLHFFQLKQGNFENLQEMSYFKTHQVSIKNDSRRGHKAPKSRIDGDKSDFLPLTITVHQKALTALIPKTDEKKNLL